MNANLLHLLHLVSPALPVGAYAYSQGLEYAIDGGWIKGEDAIADWVLGVMQHSLGYLDVPVFLRCYDAWREDDLATVERWNQFVRAARETRELLLEDQQLGVALQRLLVTLSVPQADTIKCPPSYPMMFALACAHWNVPRHVAAVGLVWSWLENQIAAATKIVPLGQSQAQKLLLRLMPAIEPTVDKASALDDHQLGLSLPGLAMASALHERQYSRLFRS